MTPDNGITCGNCGPVSGGRVVCKVKGKKCIECPKCGLFHFETGFEVQEYREVMNAEMHPDVYAGEWCDGIAPAWHGSADGDKDGAGPIGGVLNLAAKTFPPGTKVTISVPCCPSCKTRAFSHRDGGKICECGFNWEQWTREVYS